MTGLRLLVTGAAGFTGKHACRMLALSGWQVTAVGSPRSLPGFADDSGAAATDTCDLTDGAAVRELIRRARPDAVLHLAGRNAVDLSWKEPAAVLAANLMSTVNLMEGIRAHAPQCRMVAAGSMLSRPTDANAATPHPYALSKTMQFMAASAWHRWYGLPIIVAEPSNLIGPGPSAGLCGKIARWAVETENGGMSTSFRLSSLSEQRDFLDVRDAVDAYEALLLRGQPGHVYAVESGVFRTLSEVKDAFDAEVRSPLTWDIGAGGTDRPPIRGDQAPIRSLGWQPVIPFGQSIHDTLAAERARIAERG